MLSWTELQKKAKAAYRRGVEWARGRSTRRRTTGARGGWGAAAWITAYCAVAIGVVVLVLATLDWNVMRGPIALQLSSRLDRDVHINGDLDVHLLSWTPTATVNGLVIEQPEWVADQKERAEPLAEIDHLRVSIDLWELITGDLVLPEFVVTEPTLRLMRDASGRANWLRDPDDGGVTPKLPAIRHFVIEGGRLDFNDAKKKLVFNGSFASEELERGAENIFRLDGKGQLNRRPFTLKMTGDPLLNIDPDQTYGFDSDIRAGDSRVVAKGTFARPFDSGAFWVNVTFSGSDLAELYYLTGLALPNTPPFRVSGELTRDRHQWRLAKFVGKVGDSDIRGTIEVDASGERPLLTGDIASGQLDFDDLGPAFGSPPSIGAGETASPEQQGEARRMQAAARVLSDKPLDVNRLRRMDADVHYRADKVVSRDFPLRSAEAQISLSKGVLKLDRVTMSFAQGVMAGSLRVDASKDIPITEMDVRLSKLRLEQFVTGLGTPPALEGELLARARLRGVGDSVHKAASTADGSFAAVVPRGEIREAFAELMGINIARALLINGRKQTEVRCAVAEFSAKDGLLNLNQFVFDTDVVRVSGEGSINLKTERMDLKLNGHSKDFRLVRVRGPITLRGPISQPVIGVEAGRALAQGGLAAGLAILVSPLAAILPFIEPGLAKDADCGALLSGSQPPGAQARNQ